MTSKGFADNDIKIETPNEIGIAEKPLKSEDIKTPRVDINILKAKLLKDEEKQFKKNMATFLSFLIGLGALGIYLSI